MTEKEFLRRLGIFQDRLDKVYKAFNTTNISTYEYIAYLKEELGLDIKNDKYFASSVE